MAKIKATIKEILYHTIEIDSEEYIAGDSSLTRLFDFCQQVKHDPMPYADDTEHGRMQSGQSDEITIESFKIEE